MRLAGRVRRLETAGGGDTRAGRRVAAYLTALRAFGGSSDAAPPAPGQPTTAAGLLAALRAWGDGQREGGNDAATREA